MCPLDPNCDVGKALDRKLDEIAKKLNQRIDGQDRANRWMERIIIALVFLLIGANVLPAGALSAFIH